MSLKNDVEQLIEKENAYQSDSARVAPFCYTQTAYDNDVVDGVEEYSFNNEQNIPLGTPEVLETSSKILKTGVRSLSSSLSRMFINHFFGRISYNLNKIHDLFYSFLNTFHAGLGQPNGLAVLDANGRLPYSMLPESAVELKGTWNADTNTPVLQDSIGTLGDTYIVEVAGTVNLGSGDITFNVNDTVLYNGSKWTRMPAGSVRTVNNKQPVNGAVTLYGSDIAMSNLDSQKLTDAINNRIPLTSTINGKSLNNSITLYGSDIPLSESDETTLDTALDSKVPKTRTVNGKTLNTDITLSASEIPVTSGSSATVETELNTKALKTRTVNGKPLSADIELTGFDISVSESDTRKIADVLKDSYGAKTFTYVVDSNESLAFWLSNGNTGTSSGGNDFTSVLIKKGSFIYDGIFVPLDTLGTKEIEGETGAEITTSKIGYSTKQYRADCKINNLIINCTLNNGSNVTYCSGRILFIATSSTSPYVYWSTDGKSWTAGTGITRAIASPTYANGIWVARTGSSPYVYWSTDGKSWTRGTGISVAIASPTYANGIWVARTSSASPYVYWSTDGKSWTAGTGISVALSDITYANGIWVARTSSASPYVYWSTDGKSWTAGTGISVRLYKIVYANGIWFASTYDPASGSTSPYVYWSTDGKSWTACTGVSVRLEDIAYANGIWVARTYSASPYVYWSTDGKSWTAGTGISGRLYKIVYANGIWVAKPYSSSSPYVYYSTDGKSWTAGTGITSDLGDIVYSNGVWVTLSVSSPYVYWSTDGKNWTAGTGITSDLSYVIYSNGIWVAGTAGVSPSRVYWSTDGKSWTAGTDSPSDLLSISYSKGIWFARTTFASPYVYCSTDGKSWTAGTGISALLNADIYSMFGFLIKDSFSVQNCQAVFEGSYATPTAHAGALCETYPTYGFNLIVE